jgi:hypothetical protein
MLDKTIELMGEDGEEGVAIRVLLFSMEEHAALPKYVEDEFPADKFTLMCPVAYRHETWYWDFYKPNGGALMMVAYFIPHLKEAAQWLGEPRTCRWNEFLRDEGLAVKDSDFEYPT